MPNGNTIRKTIRIEGPFSFEFIRPLIEHGLPSSFICVFLKKQYEEEIESSTVIILEYVDLAANSKPDPIGPSSDLEVPPIGEIKPPIIERVEKPEDMTIQIPSEIIISDKAKELLQKAKDFGCYWAFREEQILNNYSNE
jgi:hypothetical protein